MSFTAASFSARTTSAVGTRHLFAALLSIWSVVLLGIFVEGNDFPAAWHWDEPSKVAQIQGEPFNFHHPLLMLDATRLLLAFHVQPSAAQIIVAGRWVSALAAVAAVDLLAIVAMLLQGEIAGLLTALLVGTNPMLFGLAHYMKEDTVYVFGLSAFFLALVRYDGKPDTSRLVQLAITAGIAASCKYIGLVTVPVALGAMAWRHRENWRMAVRPSALVLGVSASVFLIVNLPIVTSFLSFFGGFRQEVKHVILTNHGGLYRPFSSTFYVEGLVRLCSPFLIAAYGWFLVRLLRRQPSRRPGTLIIALLPIAYALMLQFSPVKVMRYELPIIMTITMLAACTFAGVVLRAARPSLRALAVMVAACVLAAQIQDLSVSRTALLDDSRSQMADWIRTHLPKNAVIAAPMIAGLADEAIDGTVITREQAADLGTLDQLRAAGITHVLVTDLSFGRYFNSTLRVDSKDPADARKVAAYRSFYEDLFSSGSVVHQVAGSTPLGTFFSPGLWLLDISPARNVAMRSAPTLPSFSQLQD